MNFFTSRFNLPTAARMASEGVDLLLRVIQLPDQSSFCSVQAGRLRSFPHRSSRGDIDEAAVSDVFGAYAGYLGHFSLDFAGGNFGEAALEQMLDKRSEQAETATNLNKI